MEEVLKEVFGIWFLIGAAFVFFMQAGFAMVETGFTRAKNAGNIIMKNLMDFCIGTVVFMFLGFGILLGEDTLGGFIGIPTLGIVTDYANFDWSNFVFNLVFCATTATIVSGAMAERTKFLSYCIYSAVISAVVYPIEAHWIWGGGWLAARGFHDFAGSCAIHMVGGFTALIGAWMEGPRIGKYNADGTPNAIPGHNIVIGALGCFILWFGWYGFNGAAATNGPQLASIFATISAPSSEINDLFYGGGFSQLLIQLTAILSVLLWTGITMVIVFKIIDKTIGLRVTDQEQIEGLDLHEHGMNAYFGFRIDR